MLEEVIIENESAYIPKTVKYKLENPGKIPFEIIEVQIEEYIKEDDIEKIKDKYGEKTKIIMSGLILFSNSV